eukprot:TRINITY_DN53416_c0_g1_i2.p1 TRINITY_DN53416_c0_g1~~TRINITY_DN53416_c0_g1_i2.p1  ORF type:complete len:104 (-),score=21.70 TRINITY_DN53416_c0_g1_i2:348-659(-)
MAGRALKPLGDRILVARAVAEQVTSGGIILADAVKTNVGKVLAVGPGAMDRDGKVIPMRLAVNAKVMLPEYGGVKVNDWDGPEAAEGDLYIFREEDIIAEITE